MTDVDAGDGAARRPAMRQPVPPPDFVSPRRKRGRKRVAENPGGRGAADAVDGPVIDRPPRVLMDIDLKKEAVRLYRQGWSRRDIASKLDRPRGTISAWIDEVLRDYVATPELVAELKQRQLLQISAAMQTIAEVMQAGGTGKLALEAVDRLVKLQQQEAETAGFKGVQAELEDQVDAALQEALARAKEAAAEQEQRLIEGDE